MTTPQIYVITVIALAGAAICAWQARRAWREYRGQPSYLQAHWDEATERWADSAQPTDDGHDVGPDALKLLDDTDLRLNQYAASHAEVWRRFGPGAPIPDLTLHPDNAAGFDRLRQAIRDQQQEDQ